MKTVYDMLLDGESLEAIAAYAFNGNIRCVVYHFRSQHKPGTKARAVIDALVSQSNF